MRSILMDLSGINTRMNVHMNLTHHTKILEGAWCGVNTLIWKSAEWYYRFTDPPESFLLTEAWTGVWSCAKAFLM